MARSRLEGRKILGGVEGSKHALTHHVEVDVARSQIRVSWQALACVAKGIWRRELEEVGSGIQDPKARHFRYQLSP